MMTKITLEARWPLYSMSIQEMIILSDGQEPMGEQEIDIFT